MLVNLGLSAKEEELNKDFIGEIFECEKAFATFFCIGGRKINWPYKSRKVRLPIVNVV